MELGAIDLNLLLAFDAMIEARSVSRAAERLGLRQPAMSAALARLRDSFGDPLFVRAAGAMQPTPLALAIAPGVADALRTLRATFDAGVPFKPTEADRCFRIASTDYTTLILLPQIMALLRERAPNASLQVVGYDKRDVAERIDRGEIDLALGVFQTPPERAVLRRLCTEHFVGIARHGHGDVAGGKISLAAYAAATHALVSVSGDARGEIDAALATRGLSRRIALVLPHMMALPGILAASDMIAAIPARVADIVGDSVQTFALPVPVAPWHIQMLWNPAARSDAAHGWMRALVAEAATAI